MAVKDFHPCNLYLSKVFSLSLRYSIYKVQTSSLSQARLGSPRTFICYHILSNLSRTFFKFFQILFDVVLHSRTLSFIAQLCYHTTEKFVCQELFQVFSNFFSLRFDVFRSRGQLRYISTSFVVCQAFFHKNLHFFLCYFTRGHQSLTERFPLISARASPAS